MTAIPHIIPFSRQSVNENQPVPVDPHQNEGLDRRVLDSAAINAVCKLALQRYQEAKERTANNADITATTAAQGGEK